MGRKHNSKSILSTEMPSAASSISVRALSPMAEGQSSNPSSHTVTPLPTDLTIQWTFQDRRPHPIITETCPTTGSQVEKIRAFEVHGVVVDFYLRADAFAHTIRLQLQSNDIDNIKAIVRTALLYGCMCGSADGS